MNAIDDKDFGTPARESATLVTLEIDGEERQHGEGSDMIFAIPTLVAEMSRHFTLEPGDVISTGSPQGVGAAMDPPTFLQPGDVVTCQIERIGTLSNPVVAV